MRRFIRFYGANPLHLLAVLLCFALVGLRGHGHRSGRVLEHRSVVAVDRSVVRRRTHRS